MLPRTFTFVVLTLLASPVLAEIPADPPVFSAPLEITNEFMPFEPGAVKVFVGRSDGERTAVVDIFTDETRSFLVDGSPVECAILQETEFTGGETSEISQNFFAQADDGSVYYFGEIVDIYEDGEVVAHDGSWLVGGASLPSDPPETANAGDPGLFMPAAPAEGDAWKPENLFPIVDETVTALKDDAKVKVPAGNYQNALKVEESSLIPDSGLEQKWYVPGIGVVKTKAKGETLVLVASTLLPTDDM